MCLALSYEEARLWKRKAQQIISDAETAAAKMTPDPLFRSVPHLSAFVSAVDSVKKRHGLLIEKALINAINRLPNWFAGKEKVQTSSGPAHLDCIAYNSATKQLYVFECKRGHGEFDADRVSAIDRRLDRVAAAIGPHVARKGWILQTPPQIFILSFYGQTWVSKYPIYDMSGIAAVFPPCLSTFTQEFSRYSELEARRNYGREFGDWSIASPDIERTIFDELDEASHLGEFVVFDPQNIRVERRPLP